MITRDLDRKITVARATIERLDGGEPLSNVLSQVRLTANMRDDMVMVALVDILTHGLLNLPYQGKPFTDPVYKEAGLIHMKLCSVEDIKKLNIDEEIDKLMKESQDENIPVKNQVITLSVYEMENQPPAPPLRPWDRQEFANLIFQTNIFQDRIKSILVRLRAYIYDYVSKIWIEATREKDRIDLLGPDYRLITDRLDALETPVGGELLAAIDNLASSNPAHWNACALICRNVVIKLGTILWRVPGDTYETRSGKILEVSPNKEKNRLYAYMDACYDKVGADKQTLLNKAKELVKPIYNKGSKGKKEIHHSEAQTLVVDTFHFIDLLNESTGLEPINTLS